MGGGPASTLVTNGLSVDVKLIEPRAGAQELEPGREEEGGCPSVGVSVPH